MKTVAILLALFLASCVSTRPAEHFKSKMHSWIGRTEDDLVAEWGAPSSVYKTDSGEKLLTYKTSSTGSTTSFYNPTFKTVDSVTSRYHCKITFILDSQNIVRHWKSDGNSCY